MVQEVGTDLGLFSKNHNVSLAQEQGLPVSFERAPLTKPP